MSIITIAIGEDSVSASLLSAIHKCLNKSNTEIIGQIKANRPIYEREIFSNNSEQEFKTIRKLLGVLEQAGVTIKVKEGGFAITPAVLENILRSSESIHDDFEKLDELGHS